MWSASIVTWIMLIHSIVSMVVVTWILLIHSIINYIDMDNVVVILITA